MAYATTVERHKTREVGVGGHIVGGDHPISVQSMTTTNTFDVAETLDQIHRLEEARRCEIVRVTVPKKEDVEACKLIRDQISIPLIADIHYDYRMALACLDATTSSGNQPSTRSGSTSGNIGGDDRFQRGRPQGSPTIGKGIPMRIGVEFGKPRKRLDRQVRVPLCPEAMHGRERLLFGISRCARTTELPAGSSSA